MQTKATRNPMKNKRVISLFVALNPSEMLNKSFAHMASGREMLNLAFSDMAYFGEMLNHSFSDMP
jgi:hypothetical protein